MWRQIMYRKWSELGGFIRAHWMALCCELYESADARSRRMSSKNLAPTALVRWCPTKRGSVAAWWGGQNELICRREGRCGIIGNALSQSGSLMTSNLNTESTNQLAVRSIRGQSSSVISPQFLRSGILRRDIYVSHRGDPYLSNYRFNCLYRLEMYTKLSGLK